MTDELLDPPEAPETEVVVVVVFVQVPGGTTGAAGAAGAAGASGVVAVVPGLVEPDEVDPPLCAIATLVFTELAAEDTEEVWAAGATDKAITLLRLAAAAFKVLAEAVSAPPLDAASLAKLLVL